MKKGKLIVVFLLALICICTLCFTACNNTDTFYTVVFDSNGGSFVESQNVRENRSAVEPASPVKDGYTFAGWYTDRNFTSRYDFRNIVTENLYLYAKWENMVYVAVNFPVTTIESKGYAFKDSSGGLNLPSRVPRGSTVNFLVETSSTLTGSLEVRINGSLLTPSYTSNPNVYSFSFVADRNFSVSAGIYYDVEFTSTYADGTINTVTRKLEQDQTVNSYEETRPGEYFGGWFYNYNGENLLATDLTVGYMVSGPILKLTGNYSYKNYTIEFVMNGGTYNGTSLEKQSITYGDFLSLYESIFKDNYIFMGWYTENNGGGQKIESGTFERDYPNNSTIKLYAYFVKNYYAIQYQSAPNEFSYTTNPSSVRYNTEGDTVFNVSISLNQPDVKVKLYYKIGSQSTEYREQVLVPDEQSQGQSINFQITLPSLPPENESIYIYYDIYYKVNFELDGGSNGNLSYDNVFVKQNTVLMRAGSEANFSSSDTRAISTLVSILYKDEYTFICWYLDEEMANQLTPNYAILSPITLYASFSYNYHIISYPSSEAESGNYDPDLGTTKYYYYAVTPTEKIPVTSSSFQLKLSFTNNTAKVIVEMFESGNETNSVYSESYLVYGSNFSNSFNIDISEYDLSTNFNIKVTVYYKVSLGSSQGIQISSNNPQSVSDDGNRVIYFNGEYYFYLKNGESVNAATKEALIGITKQYHNFIEYTSDDQGESAIDLETFNCTGSTTIYPQFEEKIYNVVLPSSGSAGYGEQEFYTVSGNSTVRADAGQYTFTINLKNKKCYYFEVSVNGTKLGDFYSDSAEGNVLNVTYPITDNLADTLNFTITVYLKTEFNLDGGYLKTQPGEGDQSGLQKISDSLYYLITGIGGKINEEAQNILLLTNIERKLNVDTIINAMGWYDGESLVELPSLTIGQNMFLKTKYNTTFYEVNLPKASTESDKTPIGFGENEFYTVQGTDSVWSGKSTYTFDLILGAKKCYAFEVSVNGTKLTNDYLYSSAQNGKIEITFNLESGVKEYNVTVNIKLKVNIILNGGAFKVAPTSESGLIEDSDSNVFYAIIGLDEGFNESAKAVLALNNIKYEDRVCLGLYYDSNFSNQFNIGDKFTENCSLYAKFDGVPKTINLPTSSSDGYGAENFYTVDGESSVQASESSYTFTLNLGAKECYAFEVSVNGTKLTNEYLYSSAENGKIAITFDLTSDVTVYTVTVNIKLKVNIILNGGAFVTAPTIESGLIEESNAYYAIIDYGSGFNESAKAALALNNIKYKDRVCLGLYYDSNFSNQFNIGDKFTENCSLYAKFDGVPKTINLPTSSSDGYGAENFYTVDGESSVQASESSYTFTLNLGAKECYAFEVSVNGTKLTNEYLYSSAENRSIAITFNLTSDVTVYTVTVNIKLKVNIILNGGAFKVAPTSESGLIEDSDSNVFYAIIGLNQGFNESAKAALSLDNIENGDKVCSGLYYDSNFSQQFNNSDTFTENRTLYAKFEGELKTINLPTSLSVGYGEENFYTVDGESSVQASESSYTFDIILGTKECYAFEVSVNGTKLTNEYLYSSAQNGKIAITFSLSEDVNVYNVVINVKLKITFNLNGASFNTQPDEESALISSGEGVYYTILDLESPLNSSAQNALALTNLSSGNNIATGWYLDQGFTNSISLTDTSFNENKTLYLKIEVKFTITFDDGVDSITKDSENFEEIVIYIEPNGAISNTYINTYLQNIGYNINYKDYYKFKSWNLNSEPLPSNGINVSAVSSFDIKLTTQRSSFFYQLTNSSTDLITVNIVVVDSDGTELGLPFAYGTLLKIGAVSNNSAYIVKAYMEKADNTLFELTRRDEAGFNYGIYFKETSETSDFSNCAYIAGFGTRDNNDDYVIKIKIEAIENTQQPTEKTFTVNYGAGISNITKGTESYESGSLQIAVALNTTITESYLNSYLSDNGYTVNYAEGYVYDGWKVGDTVLTESGITVTESTSTALTLLADEIVAPVYHTIVLPQGTNSNGVNYDVNCEDEYEVLSTETSAAVGETSYDFKIKVLKSNIARIEIYANSSLEGTQINPNTNTEYYNYPIGLAQTQTTYTITVKVYYNLELYINGATTGYAENLGLNNYQNSKFYKTYEKGSNIDNTLKTALRTNTYNGNPLFTKANCTFGGWYTDLEFNNPVDFDNLSIDSTTSLYLKMVIEFTIRAGTEVTITMDGYQYDGFTINIPSGTVITAEYLENYLYDNGYILDYTGYRGISWMLGESPLPEDGILASEANSTILTVNVVK